MYETFAELPGFLPEILGQIDTGMETAAGLGDTAQALESPNAISGVAKQVVVGQAKVALSQIYQNFVAFVTRYWRIKAQFAQRKLTVPQQVQYSGIDSAFKQRWFTGADFLGVKDVSIATGSGTMQAPVEKQQSIAFAQQAGWMDLEEAADAGRSTIAGDLGLGDNPHTQLIARQLAEWSEGPPKGWTPAQPAVDQTTGQPAVDPTSGQPQMQPPSWTPFEPRPTDEDPTVAKAQYKNLRDFIATADYSKQPPEWRMLVDQRYQQSAYAAGIQTVRQQYEAQDKQQQAAQRPPLESIAFKDLPPEGQQQMAAQAGIQISAQQQPVDPQIEADQQNKAADRQANQDAGHADRAHQAHESAAERMLKLHQTEQDRAAQQQNQEADRNAKGHQAAEDRTAKMQDSAANRQAQTDQKMAQIAGNIASQAAKPKPKGTK